MANSAEKKQAAAIRQRMQEIRSELPYHMDDARQDVKGFLDWKTHVRKHPMVAAALVAGVAYWIVPAKAPPTPPPRNRLHHLLGGKSNEEAEAEVQKKTLLSGVVSSLLTLGLRSALSFATQQAASHFTNTLQRSSMNPSPFQQPQPVPSQRGQYR